VNNSRLSLYLQSIRGPVLLMTLGALCALHQANILSFRLTWPVLIIVVGVLVLAERLVAPPVVAAPYQNPAGRPGVSPSGWPNPRNPPPGGPR
jgi:hypothetical protein